MVINELQVLMNNVPRQTTLQKPTGAHVVCL